MKKFIAVLIVTILVTFCLSNCIYASSITESMRNLWNKDDSSASSIKKMGGKVLYVTQLVGYAVALITLTILGIRYMYSSTNDKATIKEKLMAYVIGAVILFGFSTVLGIINSFISGINV